MLGRTQPRRRAFTLLELLFAMVAMTALMGGLASALMLASRAIPDDASPAAVAIDAYYAVDQIAGEIFCAKSFSERTATAITFTVADRNNDATAETIRYAWSGTQGDPLTRQYNAASATTELRDVYEFDLSYVLYTLTEAQEPTETESAETLLSSHATANDGNSFSVTSSNWPGQYFRPSLSAEATGWKVTRVQIDARSQGTASGVTLIQIRTVDASNLPTTTVLEQVSMLESKLPSESYGTQEFSFSGVSGIAPTQGLCLVLQHVSDASSADVRFDNSGGSGMLTTGDGGATWTNSGSKALNYYVYGTVTELTSAGTVSKDYLIGVSAVLRAGADVATRVDTSVQVLNAPKVSGP